MADGGGGGTTLVLVILPKPTPAASPRPAATILPIPSAAGGTVLAVRGSELPDTGFAAGDALLLAVMLLAFGVLLVTASRSGSTGAQGN